MAGGEDGVILAAVALTRGNVADAAVTVLIVVPTYEFSCPGPSGVEVGEALGGELGAVLGGAEQRLGVGVGVSKQLHPMVQLSTEPYG